MSPPNKIINHHFRKIKSEILKDNCYKINFLPKTKAATQTSEGTIEKFNNESTGRDVGPSAHSKTILADVK